jgi:hypothetical protein
MDGERDEVWLENKEMSMLRGRTGGLVKLGVVGCGYWGPKHARNICQLSDAALAWVSDCRTDRLEHMRALYPGVQATPDTVRYWPRMLRRW